MSTKPKLLRPQIAIGRGSTISAQSMPLYTKFTFTTSSLTAQYNALKVNTNTSEPITFDAKDPSIDYNTDTWMDPCYKMYIATNATLLVFWINDDIMTCEAMVMVSRPGKVRYPITSLMRTERAGDRC
ncbi:hypothetical protein CAEBREN_10701 [Caenorhabditis brenneri]|uniref:Uncharacterized protein n=1 Tax=Caenorhabditis brenneri TaxID=135651 RepID=G0P320_CAEBE|nr:hypothetical protein CAEBREN_10701 [Caenorhabditis brenneri]